MDHPVPICSPNVLLSAAIFQQFLLAVGVHSPATREDSTLDIHGQFDVAVERLQHLVHLLHGSLLSDNMNHSAILGSHSACLL